jgi:Uma2 family endonuclease
LEDYYRDNPQVYVAGNLLLYYVEDDPSQSVAPDVFVVFGVPKGDRRVYKVWEEGKGPDVVIELTSQSTSWQDRGPKKGTYEVLGVREYFLFDPLGEYLDPPLVRYRLEEGIYWHTAGDRLDSAILGLELRVEDNLLRLYDPKTGEKLLTPLEAQEARRQAEAEIERLRTELARMKKD